VDYKSALEVDKNNLDEEAVQSPSLFDEFARREAPAKTKYETLKDLQKVVMADVSLEIRGWKTEEINKFFKLELTKVTEDVYKQLVLIHPKVVKLYEEIAEARNEYNIYSAGRESMDKKIFMLSTLKDLHGQGYFAKIEGGSAFRKITMDMKVEDLKEFITERIKREGGVKFTSKTPKTPKRVK